MLETWNLWLKGNQGGSWGGGTHLVLPVLRSRFIHAMGTPPPLTPDGALRRPFPIATSASSSGGSRGLFRPLWWPTLPCFLSPCTWMIALSIPCVIPALLRFWVDSPFSPSRRIPSLVLLPPREFFSFFPFLHQCHGFLVFLSFFEHHFFEISVMGHHSFD